MLEDRYLTIFMIMIIIMKVWMKLSVVGSAENILRGELEKYWIYLAINGSEIN